MKSINTMFVNFTYSGAKSLVNNKGGYSQKNVSSLSDFGLSLFSAPILASGQLRRIWKYAAMVLLCFMVGVGNVWGDCTVSKTAECGQIESLTLTAVRVSSTQTKFVLSNASACLKSGDLQNADINNWGSGSGPVAADFKSSWSAGDVAGSIEKTITWTTYPTGNINIYLVPYRTGLGTDITGAWFNIDVSCESGGGEGGDCDTKHFYFVNTFTDRAKFSTPYAYLWEYGSDPVNNNATWPGVALTKATDISSILADYVYEVTYDGNFDKVIFSDNGSNEKAQKDISDCQFYMNGDWYGSIEEVEAMMVFFVNTGGWSDADVKVHIWKNGGSAMNSWNDSKETMYYTGTQTNDNHKVYFYPCYPDYYDKIQFHNNGGNSDQPSNQVLEATHFFNYGDQCYYTSTKYLNFSNSGWSLNSFDWSDLTGTVQTATITISNAESNYEFNIKSAGESYYYNHGTMTENNCTNWKFNESSSSNCWINPDVVGDYLFKYDFAENKLSVVYPPYMTSASLDSKTHNSAMISVASTRGTKYKVTNSDGSVEYTVSNGGAPTDGNITVTGLSANTQYSFKVYALDDNDTESANYSTVSLFYTLANMGSASAATSTCNSITLNVSSTGGVKYTVKSTDGATTYLDKGTPSDGKITVSSLSVGTAYNFYVYAVNSADELSTNYISVSPSTAGAPATPSSISINTRTYNSITLNVTSANSTKFEYSTNAASNWKTINSTGTIEITELSSESTALSPNTSYTFLIRGKNDCGDVSAGNTEFTAKTTPQMTSASYSSKTSNSVVLSVSSSGGYTYKVTNTAGDVIYTVSNSGAPTDGKITITGLSGYTNYTFRVYAMSSDATPIQSSNYVDVSNIRTNMAAPTAPSLAACKVVNVYSTTYDSEQPNTASFNNWGSSNSSTTEEVDGTDMIKVTVSGANRSYFGLPLMDGASETYVDASEMKKLHVDIWAENSDAGAHIYPVKGTGNPAEDDTYRYDIGLTGGTWNSFDIELKDFYYYLNSSTKIGADGVANFFVHIFQFKIDGLSTEQTNTLYITNLYFYDEDASCATKYSVTMADDGNGSAEADEAEYEKDATVTLTATPDIGYAFSSWTITKDEDGSDVTSTLLPSSSTNKNATFTMPAYGVTVTATFVADAHTLPCDLGFYYSITGGEGNKEIMNSDFSYSCNKDYAKNNQSPRSESEVCFSNPGPYTLTSRKSVTFPTTSKYVFTFPLYIKDHGNYDAPRVTVNGSQTTANIISTATDNVSQNYVVELDVTAGTYPVSVWIGNTNEKVFFSTLNIAAKAAATTYAVTVNRNNDAYGTVTGANTYTAGETVTITATPQSGYGFVNWTTSDDVTFADANSASTTFTMPSKNVTVQANFAEATCMSTKTIEAESYIPDWFAYKSGAGISKPTDGEFSGTSYVQFNQETEINYFITLPAANYKFHIYHGGAGNSKYFNLYGLDDSAGSDYVTYNGHKYKNTAYKGTAMITNEGRWTDEVIACNLSANDYIIGLYGNDGSNVIFDKIVIEGYGNADNDVFCKHDITVNTTTGASADATASVSKALAGETVTVTAAAASDGYRFTGWTATSGTVTFANASSLSTTFVMPDADVTVQANYVVDTKYTVHYEVVGGNGTISAEVKSSGAAVSDGDEIAEGTILTFTATPSSGYSILGWYTYISPEETYQELTRGATTFDYEVLTNITIRVKFVPIMIALCDVNNIGSNTGEFQYRDGNDSESSLTASEVDDPDSKFTNHKVLRYTYNIKASNYYRGITLPEDAGYTTSVASGATGIGFWYRTESTTDDVLMYFKMYYSNAWRQDMVFLPATNQKWKYYYLANSNVTSATGFGFYINGSGDGKATGVINSEGHFWLSEVRPLTISDVTVNSDEKKSIPMVVRDLTIYQGGQVTNEDDILITRNIYYHRHAKGGALSNKLDQWYTFAVPFTVTDIEVNESSTWYDINAVYYSDNNDNQSGTPTGLGHFYLQYLSATNVSAMGSEFADRWRYITPDHSLYLDANAADWEGSRYGYPMKDSAYIILFDSTDPIGDYFDNNTEIRFVGGAQTIDGTAKEWKVESNGEEYYLYANNTLHNFTLTGSAYILNDAGTNFDLQETPTIRPFECYVQGTNALKEKYQSLPMRRPGGGGIVTGMEKTGLEDSVQVIKVIEDGRLIIIRNGRHYNAMGARVK